MEKIESLRVFKLDKEPFLEYNIFSLDEVINYWSIDVTPLFKKLFEDDFNIKTAFIPFSLTKGVAEAKARCLLEMFNDRSKRNYYLFSFNKGTEVFIQSQSGKIYRLYGSEFSNISRVKSIGEQII